MTKLKKKKKLRQNKSLKLKEVKKFEKKLGLKDFVEKVKYPLKSWGKLFHHIYLHKRLNI